MHYNVQLYRLITIITTLCGVQPDFLQTQLFLDEAGYSEIERKIRDWTP